MELLKIKENRPYKDRNSDIEFLRDWCCLYINEDLKWELCLNGEIKEGYEVKSLSYLIKTIVDQKNKHQKIEKYQRRLIIWVNSPSILQVYIQLLSQNLQIGQIEKFIKGKRVKIIDRIYNKDLEFRNFDLISGETVNEVKKTYNFNSQGVKIMVDFLKKREEQGLNGWGQIRYTFSNNNLKLFYKRFNKDILQELRFEAIKRIPSLEFNTILQEASKQGIMLCRRETINTMLTNVYSFDISSAYNSQFIRGNDFPIGRVKRAPIEELRDLIAQQKWFLIVMVSSYPIEMPFEWIKAYEKEGYFYYVIGNYDYRIIQESGGSLSRIDKNWKIFKVFKCSEEGYLNMNFRDELVNLYEMRQQLKAKKDNEEKIYKQIGEVLYGKGIQRREFKTNQDIYNFYSKRDVMYVGPQISYHALQRTRYEIMKMLKLLDYSYIACDTDSIKTQNIMAPQVFSERNKEILEENKKAGFPNTRIGLWKFEGLYPHFIQFGNKVYAYEENDKIVCKFAGCLKEASSNYFNKISLQEGLRLLQNEDLAIPNGIIKKVLVAENNELIIKQFKYSYNVRGGEDKDEIDMA